MTTLTSSDPTSEGQPSTVRSLRKPAVVFIWLTVPVVGYLVFVLFSGATPLNLAASAFGLLLWLMLVRVPVGMALAAVGLLGIWAIAAPAAAISGLEQSAWSSSSNWTLSVIPMFVLMGMLLERSGLGSDVFRAVKAIVGKAPAGLAISTNFAGASMGAASGSTLGIVYAVGRIGIPQMVKAGYDRRFAAGAVLMAGTGGQLIPPSILLVVYAGIAQVPVGEQLMAGLVPGILLHVAYALMMVALVFARPSLAPARDGERMAWRERVRESLGVWPVLVLVALVLGGLYQGVFTATEAGAFGAVAAAVMVIATKGVGVLRRTAGPAIRDTVIASGGIFLIIIGGDIFGRFMTLTGLPRQFSEWLDAANTGPVGFMLLVLVLYLVLGTFMDPVPMMLVTVPILLPVAIAVGVDPLVFGVFAVLLGELAVLTPPVGILVFVVFRIARDAHIPMTLTDVNKGASWFYPISIAFALSMVFLPEYLLWLPGLME